MSNRGALEPTDVKMMGAVLDAAWGSIQHAFHGQPQVTIEGGRTTLAKAVIDRVTLGVADTGVLKREAIRTVKVTYPHLPI